MTFGRRPTRLLPPPVRKNANEESNRFAYVGRCSLVIVGTQPRNNPAFLGGRGSHGNPRGASGSLNPKAAAVSSVTISRSRCSRNPPEGRPEEGRGRSERAE